jgi:hypothetical protein
MIDPMRSELQTVREFLAVACGTRLAQAVASYM